MRCRTKQATENKTIEDELAPLNELNSQLSREIKQLQGTIHENQTQIGQLEEMNKSLQLEIQQTKERHSQMTRDAHVQFQERLDELAKSKEAEMSLVEEKMAKMAEEIEGLNAAVSKLQAEKRSLEEEVNLFNESKQAMSKYDWQMNEILQMVNEEKVVRGHLRTLASKLIEEVDTLRSQTALSASSSLHPIPSSNHLASSSASASAAAAGGNAAAWKNRCSEKRDRINVTTMQISLDKEVQAKVQLVEENNSLKQEIEAKQHRINDMQAQIEQSNKQIGSYQQEVNEMRDEIFQLHQKLMSAQSAAAVAAASSVSTAFVGNVNTLSVVNGNGVGGLTTYTSDPKFGGMLSSNAAGGVGAGSQLLNRHISNASAHSGSALNGSSNSGHNHSYQQQSSHPGDDATDYSSDLRPQQQQPAAQTACVDL